MKPTNCDQRNQAKGFACRVGKNLEFIVTQRREEGADVHEVTQIVLSLLGLIVFPWEREYETVFRRARRATLDDLERQGWPVWEIHKDECHLKDDMYPPGSLVHLIKHLRNAVAHGRIRFSSDDRDMEKVDITFQDAPSKDKPPYWEASISAKALKVFCEKFVDFVLE